MGGGKRGLDPKTLPRVSLLKRHSYRNSFHQRMGFRGLKIPFCVGKRNFQKLHHQKFTAEDGN